LEHRFSIKSASSPRTHCASSYQINSNPCAATGGVCSLP
jgi:hypothetical protein